MKTNKDIGYVCSDCAQKAGGVWPEGHLSTFHTGNCQCCGKETGLCHVRNWGYPDFSAIIQSMEMCILIGGRSTPISQASTEQLREALEMQELTQDIRDRISSELQGRQNQGEGEG